MSFLSSLFFRNSFALCLCVGILFLVFVRKLLVCGQALSHCVNFTFTDILETWPADLKKNLVLLTDGTSHSLSLSSFIHSFFDVCQRPRQ